MPIIAAFAAAQASSVTAPAGLEAHLKAMNLPALTACGVIILWAFICWIRMLVTAAQLRRCRKADDAFLKAHQDASHSLEVFQDGLTFEGAPRHAVYLTSAREVAFHLMGTDFVDKNFSIRLRAAGRISPSQMDSVRKVQERTADFTSRELGDGLGDGSVDILPFLGLVAALVSVLVDVSAGVTGSQLVVSAVTPMALGALVFIPLMLWHNALVQRVQDLAGELGDFAVELATQFDRAFVDHRKPLESLPSLGSMVPFDGPTFALPPSDTSRSIPVMSAP
ncbi:hypothetical protein [Verrucomicrobium sp. BvORR106]|uniref:hypothetical protein n=1 Tax=Verrucomicrobium sp. BvORR106 TaxID=1403819 RepID=UPI00056DE0B1|nr:hypothetical protein [Verrucomicrobium sp. BvORR106]